MKPKHGKMRTLYMKDAMRVFLACILMLSLVPAFSFSAFATGGSSAPLNEDGANAVVSGGAGAGGDAGGAGAAGDAGASGGAGAAGGAAAGSAGGAGGAAESGGTGISGGSSTETAPDTNTDNTSADSDSSGKNATESDGSTKDGTNSTSEDKEAESEETTDYEQINELIELNAQDLNALASNEVNVTNESEFRAVVDELNNTRGNPIAKTIIIKNDITLDSETKNAANERNGAITLHKGNLTVTTPWYGGNKTVSFKGSCNINVVNGASMTFRGDYGSKLILKPTFEDKSYTLANGALFNVSTTITPKSQLNFDSNIIIQGGDLSYLQGAKAISLSMGDCTFGYGSSSNASVIKDWKLTNTKFGTVQVGENSSFTLNYANIENCSAMYGGAVSLTGNGSNFSLNGGSITGCESLLNPSHTFDDKVCPDGSGGAIFAPASIKCNVTINGKTFNGGEISNCKAAKFGGAIAILSNESNPLNPSQFMIYGDNALMIHDNNAKIGGGIYLRSTSAEISESFWRPSAVYVYSNHASGVGDDIVFINEKYIPIKNNYSTWFSPYCRISGKPALVFDGSKTGFWYHDGNPTDSTSPRFSSNNAMRFQPSDASIGVLNSFAIKAAAPATVEIPVVTGIQITGRENIYSSTESLLEGQTRQLGLNITPANAVNKTATWTSTKPNVATVDNTGKITAKKAYNKNESDEDRTTTIIVQCGYKTVTFNVTIICKHDTLSNWKPATGSNFGHYKECLKCGSSLNFEYHNAKPIQGEVIPPSGKDSLGCYRDTCDTCGWKSDWIYGICKNRRDYSPKHSTRSNAQAYVNWAKSQPDDAWVKVQDQPSNPGELPNPLGGSHYLKCDIDGCNEHLFEAGHTMVFSEKDVIEQTSYTKPGRAKWHCSVCGYTVEAEVAKLISDCGHNNPKMTELKSDNYFHWYECGGGGSGNPCAIGFKYDVVSHDYESKVIKEPSATEAGIREYRCKDVRCDKNTNPFLELIIWGSSEAPSPDKNPLHQHNYGHNGTKAWGAKAWTCICGDGFTHEEYIPYLRPNYEDGSGNLTDWDLVPAYTMSYRKNFAETQLYAQPTCERCGAQAPSEIPVRCKCKNKPAAANVLWVEGNKNANTRGLQSWQHGGTCPTCFGLIVEACSWGEPRVERPNGNYEAGYFITPCTKCPNVVTEVIPGWEKPLPTKPWKPSEGAKPVGVPNIGDAAGAGAGDAAGAGASLCEHEYIWRPVKYVTRTTDGSQYRICTKCGESTFEVLPADPTLPEGAKAYRAGAVYTFATSNEYFAENGELLGAHLTRDDIEKYRATVKNKEAVDAIFAQVEEWQLPSSNKFALGGGFIALGIGVFMYSVAGVQFGGAKGGRGARGARRRAAGAGADGADGDGADAADAAEREGV